MATLPAPAFETRRFPALGRGDRRSRPQRWRQGNAASLDRRGGGMLFGAELDSGGWLGYGLPWRVGVAGGFTRTRFDIDQRRSDGTQDAVHAALYGGARFGAVNLRAGAAYAWNQRTNLTPPRRAERLLRRAAFRRSRGDGPGFRPRSAMPCRLGSVAFEPFVQVAAWRAFGFQAWSRGGAAALRLNGRDQNLGFSTLGLRAERSLARRRSLPAPCWAG